MTMYSNGSIAAADVDPIADYIASYPADVSGALANERRSALDLYIKNGFLVQNATDTAGYIYVLHGKQYEAVQALITNCYLSDVLLAIDTNGRYILVKGLDYDPYS